MNYYTLKQRDKFRLNLLKLIFDSLITLASATSHFTDLLLLFYS